MTEYTNKQVGQSANVCELWTLISRCGQIRIEFCTNEYRHHLCNATQSKALFCSTRNQATLSQNFIGWRPWQGQWADCFLVKFGLKASSLKPNPLTLCSGPRIGPCQNCSATRPPLVGWPERSIGQYDFPWGHPEVSQISPKIFSLVYITIPWN